MQVIRDMTTDSPTDDSTEVSGTDLDLNREQIIEFNLKHLEPVEYTQEAATGAPGDRTITLSYGTIAEYLGVGVFSGIMGNTDMDIINILETRIKSAIRDDVTEIIKRRITEVKSFSRAKKTTKCVNCLGNVAVDFFTMFFKSTSSQYQQAPGVYDSVEQTLRRANNIRQTWQNWQEQVGRSTDNFVKDVLLHIRTTSYYLWAYFVCMQALEVVAVRAFL